MTYDLQRLLSARHRRRREPVTLRPIEVTRELRRDLYRIATRGVRAFEDLLSTEIRRLYSERVADAMRAVPAGDGQTGTSLDTAAHVRVFDAPIDDIEAVLQTFENGRTRLAADVRAELRQYAVRVERWHNGQWRARVRAAADFDPVQFMRDLDATEDVALFVEWSTSLITNVDEEMLRRVRAILLPATVQRRPVLETMREIRKAMGITRRRALLIARDQSNKLSGAFDQLRHREAGVEQYRWVTSLDERVRPSHSAKHGRVYSWDEPPRDTGHPRTDINCRCTAQAWVPMLEEVQRSRNAAGQEIDPFTGAPIDERPL